MQFSVPFPYRLAAVDVDDTLLGPDKAVSPANREAVDQLTALGCRVVLASGRRHANLARLCTALSLDSFAISCQGARVEHIGTGEIIHSAVVDPAYSQAVLYEGVSRGLTVIVWQAAGIFCTAESAWTDAYRSQTGNDAISVRPAAELASQPAEKIVWLGEASALSLMKRSAEVGFGGRLALTQAHDWCLEFSAAGASKGAALAAIARNWHIPRGAVLAFGDGYNDVSMLKWAGLGVAMAHGRDSARLAAHRISPAGDADSALARAVREILLRYPAGTGAPLGR